MEVWAVRVKHDFLSARMDYYTSGMIIDIIFIHIKTAFKTAHSIANYAKNK